MTKEELLKMLDNTDCDDPFECPWGMYGKNKNGNYGCFARWPHGDPDEPDQGCIGQQAAKLIRSMEK